MQKIFNYLHQFTTCHKSQAETRTRLNNLTDNMRKIGLVWRNIGNPTTDIGIALELADQYNVKLARGDCYAKCIAYIERKDWLYDIDKSIRSEEYGTWQANQDPDTVESIYGYAGNVPEAVSRCLLFSRIAGVI